MIGSVYSITGWAVIAIGVRHLQRIFLALLHDIGNARAEYAHIARQFFVDHIGDPMRGGAQLFRRHGFRIDSPVAPVLRRPATGTELRPGRPPRLWCFQSPARLAPRFIQSG